MHSSWLHPFLGSCCRVVDWGWEKERVCQNVKQWIYRDPPPKNFLSPKSHILDSNGVWYSSFWSEATLQSQVPDIYLSQFNSYGGIDKGQLFHFASPQLSLSSPSPSPDYSFLRQAELNCTVLVKEERMLINLHH